MNEPNRMTVEALVQKIRWEGGLWAALEYGIEPAEIDDPEIADLWARLQARFLALEPLFEEASERLGVAA